jgi:hypothetical protein
MQDAPVIAKAEATLPWPYRKGVPIHVVATTLSATSDALRVAAPLAKALESRIHVIAARQMPSEWSFDQQSAPVQAFAHDIMKLPEVATTPAHVLPCVCRRLSDVVQLLAPHAIVVIAGPSYRWWPSPEKRLADVLTGRGCHVLIVQRRRLSRRGHTFPPRTGEAAHALNLALDQRWPVRK